MGERAIINRINKLRELEAQQKAIEEQMDALKAEIKKDMQEKELTEMQAGNFVVRFITVCSNKFDSKLFKKEHEALYKRYLKPSESTRFTIV